MRLALAGLLVVLALAGCSGDETSGSGPVADTVTADTVTETAAETGADTGAGTATETGADADAGADAFAVGAVDDTAGPAHRGAGSGWMLRPPQSPIQLEYC